MLRKSEPDHGGGCAAPQPEGERHRRAGQRVCGAWQRLTGVDEGPRSGRTRAGKLLSHLGPERILWGTDAIWYGSPQDQIQAFRTFQISAEFQERYGCPALTDETRRKIFSFNAARVYGVKVEEIRRAQVFDPVARAREEYRHAPDPSFVSHGPRTLEEFAAVQRAEGRR